MHVNLEFEVISYSKEVIHIHIHIYVGHCFFLGDRSPVGVIVGVKK